MNEPADRILFLPVEEGVVAASSAHGRHLLFGAVRATRLPLGADPADVICVQPFRPDFVALRQAGMTVLATPPEGAFAAVFVRISRYRALAEAWIEAALAHLSPGGWLVVAGGLKDGADAVVKRLTLRFPHGERRSKSHGVMFAARIERPVAATAPAVRPNASGWTTSPGAFSADAIDPASRMLLESLPDDIAGRVADFGAGWGYLAGSIAQRCAGVCHVDLYEADFDALEAAKANLAVRLDSVEVGYFWLDLASEPVTRRYDVIVANPPFHASRAADPELGRAFITAAAKALKQGGRLFLVANRTLPYERTLAAAFAESGELRRDARFKVLYAVR